MKKTPRILLLSTFIATGQIAPLEAEVVGWRTDGTGQYPQAKLPAKWGEDAAAKWNLKTKAWGNAMPVVVGETVFITEEPTKLIAVDLKTGKQLWEASNMYEEVLDEKQLAFFKSNQASAEKLIAERQALQDERNKLRRKERQLEKDDSKKAEAEAMQQKRKELDKQINELNAKLNKNPGLDMPKTHNVNGYASFTPVSDGGTVVAAFGNGVVAAYDLEGKRKWARWVQNPDHGWGGCVSPALADGKVIVRFDDHVALDLKTGEEVWRLPGQQSFGSPVVVEAGGKPFYVSARGEVIDVQAGKMVADNIFNMKEHRLRLSAPVVSDGVIYAVDGIRSGGATGRAVAVKIPDSADGEWKKLWESKAVERRHYASPIVHGGFLYALAEDGNLAIYDVKTGKLVKETEASGLKRRTYPSFVLAGDELLLSDEHGNALVVESGAELKEAGNVKVTPYRSTPVFAGETMLIRNQDGLVAY